MTYCDIMKLETNKTHLKKMIGLNVLGISFNHKLIAS